MRWGFFYVCMYVFFLFFVFLVCFFLFFLFLTVFCDDWASCSNGFLYSYKECTLVCQFDNVFFFVLICSIIFKSVHQTSEPSKDCGTFFEGEDCNKGWDCIFVFSKSTYCVKVVSKWKCFVDFNEKGDGHDLGAESRNTRQASKLSSN